MQIGKERCERKAYPHRVYLDRNRIWLRVNEASVLMVTFSDNFTGMKLCIRK